MFLWRTPRGLKAFGIDQDFADRSASLAANQGLYGVATVSRRIAPGAPGAAGRGNLRPVSSNAATLLNVVKDGDGLRGTFELALQTT